MVIIGGVSNVVAPRAGAWIETDLGYSDVGYDMVAPRAGAWIETADHPSLMS